MFFGATGRDACWCCSALLLSAPLPSRAEAPETPFAEVFAQLAARLVGVVVNISTTQATAARAGKGGARSAAAASGSAARGFFPGFFRREGRPWRARPAGAAGRITRFGVHHRSIGARRHQQSRDRQCRADHRDVVRRHDIAGRGHRARRGNRSRASESRAESAAAGRNVGGFEQRRKWATGCSRSAIPLVSAAR